MSLGDVLVLAVLGGVFGLDTVSFPQAMLSRPIVAATLTGALLGNASLGLLLGATLELFAVETLPFGASRYPEWGSSSVVGGALYVTTPPEQSGALATSVLATLIVAWIGGWTMVRLRKLNARWARQHHEAVAQGSRRVVVGLQLSGLTADLARGVTLTAAALLLLKPLQVSVLATWTGRPELSRAVVAATAAAVALGAAYKLFHAVPGFLWQFALGVAAGLVALVIL
jgi:PTS system mannose-specific IIC component